MRTPTPLPPQLQGRTFTRSDAIAFGVPDHRLRARDIVRVCAGVYRHEDPGTDPHPSSRTGPAKLSEHDLEEMMRALCMKSPSLWASHTTAARLYGLTIPGPSSSRVHLTALHHRSSPVLDVQLTLHRARRLPEDLREIRGVRRSSPERLLVELSSCVSLTDQVIIGDQLVRQPYRRFEGRTEPWTSMERLHRTMASLRGRRGVGRAREALSQIRVGSDSPPETLMRLMIIGAGLPEPELQIRTDPHDPHSPAGDAGYRQEKIVIQYEGEHHFSPEQQAEDQWRNAHFEAQGWTVVLVNRVDLRDGFRTLIRRLKTLLSR